MINVELTRIDIMELALALGVRMGSASDALAQAARSGDRDKMRRHRRSLDYYSDLHSRLLAATNPDTRPQVAPERHLP